MCVIVNPSGSSGKAVAIGLKCIDLGSKLRRAKVRSIDLSGCGNRIGEFLLMLRQRISVRGRQRVVRWTEKDPRAGSADSRTLVLGGMSVQLKGRHLRRLPLQPREEQIRP